MAFLGYNNFQNASLNIHSFLYLLQIVIFILHFQSVAFLKYETLVSKTYRFFGEKRCWQNLKNCTLFYKTQKKLQHKNE